MCGIGLCAPGLPDWPTGMAVLTGQRTYSPDEPLRFDRVRLPRNEARRASLTVRLALQAATEALDAAGMDAGACSAVFACSGGNTEALDALCRALLEPGRPVSPNQFNNSVHNAPLGYWTIAGGSRQPATSVGAYDASFAAGLLESVALAAVEHRSVLLVAFDTPPPPALQPFRTVSVPFGVALLLTPELSPGSWVRLFGWRISIAPPPPNPLPQREGEVDCNAPSPLAGEGGLSPKREPWRLSNPAARSLPLLRLIAHRQAGAAQLPYWSGCLVEFQVEPC